MKSLCLKLELDSSDIAFYISNYTHAFHPSCKFVKKLCMALDFTAFLLSLGRVVKSLYPTSVATNSISSSNIERQLAPDLTHHGLIKKIISWVFSLYKTFIHWSSKYLQSARHILSTGTKSVNKTKHIIKSVSWSLFSSRLLQICNILIMPDNLVNEK